MYKLRFRDGIYTIPKENLKAFALYKALQHGITHGNIHDDETAKDFLEGLGIEVIDATEEI